jgi:hypothetical protein
MGPLTIIKFIYLLLRTKLLQEPVKKLTQSDKLKANENNTEMYVKYIRIRHSIA